LDLYFSNLPKRLRKVGLALKKGSWSGLDGYLIGIGFQSIIYNMSSHFIIIITNVSQICKIESKFSKKGDIKHLIKFSLSL